MNIDEMINGWTFKETVQTAENLMEAEKNMFTWDVIRHLRDFLELYSEQLKEYQQLEEQDRLVKLPCKVGDVVYRINIGAMKPVIPLRVVEYRFKIVGNCIRKKICCSDDFLCKQPSIIYYAEDIGNKVFLTKAEAEAKLKELRGEENER